MAPTSAFLRAAAAALAVVVVLAVSSVPVHAQRTPTPPPSTSGNCVIQRNGNLRVTPAPSWRNSDCISLYASNYTFLAQQRNTNNGAAVFDVNEYFGGGGEGATYIVEGYTGRNCRTRTFIDDYSCTATLALGATAPPPPTAPPAPSGTCVVQSNGNLLVTPSWSESQCITIYDNQYGYLAQARNTANGVASFTPAEFNQGGGVGSTYIVEGYKGRNCRGRTFIADFACTVTAAQ
jgi:hypothetical protein